MNNFNKKILLILCFILLYNLTNKREGAGGWRPRRPRLPRFPKRELPSFDPMNYPELRAIPLPEHDIIESNKKPPKRLKHFIKAPHRYTEGRGFLPLTRKDFPKWIDDYKNPIARKWDKRRKKLYKKRAQNLGWKKPLRTMALKGISSRRPLGGKARIYPKKVNNPYFNTRDMNWLN